MVTSNKLPDKKVVKMEQSAIPVPQRTLLGEVNEHITCPLCRGYYIDATTIVECLHSFCRSCIIKHLQIKSYCPVCEMMINSAKPNIKLDKALQDIVYKLVPGLFQKEMERRQNFYSSRPGPAASATPEQRGEDTERIIFSPEDVISFSMEYADCTDTDSISSKSSDSNDPSPTPVSTRRYLQCPAVVNINHLKKFLSMKFDIDSTQFAIDILYKRVPLPEYYTLMDIAYIYNWKRNEPMRFFYQIIDYVAMRNRIFEINRLQINENKMSPISTEDTNTSSPAVTAPDQVSEASEASGTDSPMPGENKNTISKEVKITPQENQNVKEKEAIDNLSLKKPEDDVEKSQFLNSFELTPKSPTVPLKTSPSKSSIDEKPTSSKEVLTKSQSTQPKLEEKGTDAIKRKNPPSQPTLELKKPKIEIEKAKIPPYLTSSTARQTSIKTETDVSKPTNPEVPPKSSPSATTNTGTTSYAAKESKHQPVQSKPHTTSSRNVSDSSGIKRSTMPPSNLLSPKRKSQNNPTPETHPAQKFVSPLKLQITKMEMAGIGATITASVSKDSQKAAQKKMPDLKPSVPMQQNSANKSPTVNKVRMDFLANNSDPTIDRSKILSQVKTSLSTPNPGQTSGDPLKSLFDSCKINIPSSLSITLTDQKLDTRSQIEPSSIEVKKPLNKNLMGGSSGMSGHILPSPPVHNYIEISKLPPSDGNTKKVKSESDSTVAVQNKNEVPPAKPLGKGSDSGPSAKGPVPNLKPIADTKLAKQSGNYSAPITFQQTFEQQLQSLQTDKKSKLPKNKAQVPKLVPATLKSLSGVNKPNIPLTKPGASGMIVESKTGTALDLSTPHTIPNQIPSQQTFDKALETMQNIANLAKKQSLPSKGLAMSLTHNVFPGVQSRPLPGVVNPILPTSNITTNQIKPDKLSLNVPQSPVNTINRPESLPKSATTQIKPMSSANIPSTSSTYQLQSHTSSNTTQPSPRSQTRSPSSSPKLVIAEDKQTNSSAVEQHSNQLSQVTSTQSNPTHKKIDTPKAVPGHSKPGLKQLTPQNTSKVSGIWQPLTSTVKTSVAPAMSALNETLSQYARQIEVNAWIKAQRQYDLMKNISNKAQQNQKDFNKDKQ